MILCVVIEDEDRDYLAIATYINEFKRNHELSDADLRIERFKTYEEVAAILRHVAHDQRTLWIIDIRLPHQGNTKEIIGGLINTPVSPQTWPLIINTVFAKEFAVGSLRRDKVELVNKLGDPPNFPSARMQLRHSIHMFLEMLLQAERQQREQQQKDAEEAQQHEAPTLADAKENEHE